MPVSTREHTTTITTITREDINAHFKKASIELELTHEVSGDDLHFRLDDSNRLVVGYLSHDDSPSDWDAFGYEDGNDEFKEFRSERERDEYIEDQESKGLTCFVVNRYKQSQVHYSVAGTQTYPDMRWDVAPSGVFTPCQENQERFKAGTITEDNLIEWANSSLDEYSKYCNGEVFGCCVDTFELQGDGSFEIVEDDACWGMTGADYATESLKSDYLASYKEVPEWKPSKDVSADNDTPRPGSGNFLA